MLEGANSRAGESPELSFLETNAVTELKERRGESEACQHQEFTSHRNGPRARPCQDQRCPNLWLIVAFDPTLTFIPHRLLPRGVDSRLRYNISCRPIYRIEGLYTRFPHKYVLVRDARIEYLRCFSSQYAFPPTRNSPLSVLIPRKMLVCISIYEDLRFEF